MNGMPIEATIIDYSTGGCQVQINTPLTIDQVVQITMQERNIQKKKHKYAGFKKGVKFTLG